LSIKLPEPLYLAELISRPNRFVLECFCEVTEKKRRIYLADPGRMPNIMVEGRKILYQPDFSNASRKTEGSAVLAKMGNKVLVSLNSHLANKVAASALERGLIKELKGFEIKKSEYSWGNSRLDFLLQGGKKYLLEVKSVTLVEKGQACFPDAVTRRGKRHLEELMEWQKKKDNLAGVLFLITRNDAEKFRPCENIDPEFSKTLAEAREQGVEIMVYDCKVDKKTIELNRAITQNW